MANDQYEELEEAEQRPFNYEYLRRMLGYARPYRSKLLVVIVAMVVASILRLMEPYLLRTAIDEGITGRDLSVLNRVAVLWLVFQFAGAIAGYLRIRVLNETGQRVLYDLRQSLFIHIQRLSLRFYDGRPVGRIMARVTNDVEAINRLINGGLVTIVSQSVSIIGIVLLMFALNWRLALMAFAVVPVLVWTVARLRPRMETGWRNVRKANSNIGAQLNESVTGIRVTKAFCREDANLASFDELNDAYYDAFMRAIKLEIIIWPLVDIVGLFGTCLVVWLGSSMVMRGDLSVGYILAFTDYLWRFWEPISAISRVYSRVLSAMASAERIFEYLDTSPEIADRAGAQSLEQARGHVRFAHVSFRYDDGDDYVLEDITFDVERGQVIALVGPTGAGKTSIINLLMRFYDPQEGRVLIDGIDLRDITLLSLRRNMAMVLQDSFLFSGTIGDNIRYSRLDALKEEVLRVSKALSVHDFVGRFEEGYEHEVKERGAGLSAGQRQLISFARALLADPRILILDEATSSVDTQTERVIQKAMATLLHGRTAFIIAHRLSTIKNADCIYMIDEGRIVEHGTHEEMLASGGPYARLYRRQFTPRETEGAAAPTD